MLQCDSHELLFNTSRKLSDGQGQVVPLSTILHKTNLLDLQVKRDMEMTVRLCGGDRQVFATMNMADEYFRVSTLQQWGSSPWLLCSDCLQRLNLDKKRL